MGLFLSASISPRRESSLLRVCLVFAIQSTTPAGLLADAQRGLDADGLARPAPPLHPRIVHRRRWVKSAANCEACTRLALATKKGQFSETLFVHSRPPPTVVKGDRTHVRAEYGCRSSPIPATFHGSRAHISIAAMSSVRTSLSDAASSCDRHCVALPRARIHPVVRGPHVGLVGGDTPEMPAQRRFGLLGREDANAVPTTLDRAPARSRSGSATRPTPRASGYVECTMTSVDGQMDSRFRVSLARVLDASPSPLSPRRHPSPPFVCVLSAAATPGTQSDVPIFLSLALLSGALVCVSISSARDSIAAALCLLTSHVTIHSRTPDAVVYKAPDFIDTPSSTSNPMVTDRARSSTFTPPSRSLPTVNPDHYRARDADTGTDADTAAAVRCDAKAGRFSIAARKRYILPSLCTDAGGVVL
ncbi:hypothetical protein B0H13DRAFT_2325363 [Mycena leptocephala]|nr:hypothetical protein B0H13DRAFT_2325363 [Mycena leptocephala]